MTIDRNILDVIAEVCHETNKAWCSAGARDFTQMSWYSAPKEQKDSTASSVTYVLENPYCSDSALHDKWSEDKRADGWVWGPVKDAEAKTHPCLVDFSELPLNQQIKDALFRSVVTTISNRLFEVWFAEVMESVPPVLRKFGKHQVETNKGLFRTVWLTGCLPKDALTHPIATESVA